MKCTRIKFNCRKEEMREKYLELEEGQCGRKETGMFS